MKTYRYVCPVHFKTATGEFKDIPLEEFLGKHVKLTFQEGDQRENMYVLVTAVNMSNSSLIGKLNNDPQQPAIQLKWKDGQMLEFERKEIVEIYDNSTS